MPGRGRDGSRGCCKTVSHSWRRPAVDEGSSRPTSLWGTSETNYGQVFDVRSVPQPENLAYSDLGLGLHTDNPYRDPVRVPRAACLIASPDGGESLFADGFALAEHLRASTPDSFAILLGHPFRFVSLARTRNFRGTAIDSAHLPGEVSAVHYNSRSIAPLRLGAAIPRHSTRPTGASPRCCAIPRFQFKLQPTRTGEIVVFDNQRILHGRTAFSSAKHARHLRGCYLTRDSVYRARRPASSRIRAGMRHHEPSSKRFCAVFRTSGSDAYFGESVSMTEHGLQAAYFAQAAGARRRSSLPRCCTTSDTWSRRCRRISPNGPRMRITSGSAPLARRSDFRPRCPSRCACTFRPSAIFWPPTPGTSPS